jgi:hypothetical protein
MSLRSKVFETQASGSLRKAPIQIRSFCSTPSPPQKHSNRSEAQNRHRSEDLSRGATCKLSGMREFTLGRRLPFGSGRPPRGPRPHDVICQTQTLAAPEPMPQQGPPS